MPHHCSGLSDGLVSALDVLPTVASLVGFNTSGLILDGVDISPLLWNPSVVVVINVMHGRGGRL